MKFRVARLQLHQILLGRRDHFISAIILSFQFGVAMRSRKESTRGFRTPPIGLGVGLSFAVCRVKILEGDLIQIDTVVSKLGQDQSDGCSPITKVVLTDHRPPPPFQSPGNGITNNSRTKMADVHTLGHIHRDHVNGHRVIGRLRHHS